MKSTERQDSVLSSNKKTASTMNDIQSLDKLSNRFPANFVWGVASSAFQIEGASAADGKGASIWDEFCRLPGVIADGSDGRIACDHYNRLQSDLDFMAANSAVGIRRGRRTGNRLLQPPGRRAVGARHRTVRHSLPLGSAGRAA